MTGGRSVLLGAVALLVVACALLPRGSPPLYDSLPVPDQPYRTLTTGTVSPQGTQPSSATAEVTPADPVINLTTSERRPQAYLLVQTGSLQPLAGATRITASLTPVPLPSPPPHDGVPLGNAYAVEVRDQAGRSLEPTPAGQRPVVQLRIPNPAAARHVVLELHDRGTWTVLKTIRTADVIYAAELPSFGTVVAVYVIGSTSRPNADSGSAVGPVWIVVAALGLVFAVAGLLALRLARRTDGIHGGDGPG